MAVKEKQIQILTNGMNQHAIELVMFDLYGTLIDIHTEEGSESLWKAISLFYGYQGAVYSAKELKDTYQMLVRENEVYQHSMLDETYVEVQLESVFQELYRRKNVVPEKELVRATGQMFRAVSTDYLKLYPGAKELVTALKKSGKHVAVLSNAQRIFTEYELRLLGIYDLFDTVFISSDWGCKKPSKRFYRLLLEKYAMKRECVLMVGNDASADIRPARELGIHTCYIHSNLSPKEDKRPECDIYLEGGDLRLLIEYLT